MGVYKGLITYKCNVRFYILCGGGGYRLIVNGYYVINVTALILKFPQNKIFFLGNRVTETSFYETILIFVKINFRKSEISFYEILYN